MGSVLPKKHRPGSVRELEKDEKDLPGNHIIIWDAFVNLVDAVVNLVDSRIIHSPANKSWIMMSRKSPVKDLDFGTLGGLLLAARQNFLGFWGTLPAFW